LEAWRETIEAYGCRYRDLTGATLTLYDKQNKTWTIESSQRLADAIVKGGAPAS
jgi:hypothetical protein